MCSKYVEIFMRSILDTKTAKEISVRKWYEAWDWKNIVIRK